MQIKWAFVYACMCVFKYKFPVQGRISTWSMLLLCESMACGILQYECILNEDIPKCYSPFIAKHAKRHTAISIVAVFGRWCQSKVPVC